MKYNEVHIFLIIVISLVATLASCSNATESESPISNLPIIESIPSPVETSAIAPPSPSSKTGWVEVVYFHREQRCNSCTYAENQTRYTLETYFSDELASGVMVFKIINLQDEANAEMVEKYGAHSSSLFITGIKDGIESIQGISGIWTKIDRDEAFTEEVKSSIEESLGNI